MSSHSIPECFNLVKMPTQLPLAHLGLTHIRKHTGLLSTCAHIGLTHQEAQGANPLGHTPLTLLAQAHW